MSVRSVLADLGGAARAGELADRGVGPGLLRMAVQSGEIVRPRKGWYVLSSLGPDVIRAVRVGGALGCVSAAKHRGLWVPDETERLHVVVPPNSPRLRSSSDRRQPLGQLESVVVHWSTPGARALESITASIRRIATCVGLDEAFAVAESAVRVGALSLPAARSLIASFPGGARIAAFLDGRSESGSESLMKLVLIRLGLPFRQQVWIDGLGRVDFVVGRDLIVEVDSREFHADQLRDRRRDAFASARGYRTLHFLYRQIRSERETVEAALVGAIVRGDVSIV